MSFLRSIFGPSKDEIWSQVADDIGANYSDGGFWGKDEIRYRAGEWELLLDTYTVSNGKSSTTYTRLRAPFVNKDGLYFKIYRESIFSGVGRFFGMQDIEIGDSFFDNEFIIRGSDEERIRLLLQDEELQSLIHKQSRIAVSVKDDEGFFGQSYPEGVDVLSFQCVGVLKDPAAIKNLFELFSVFLARLVQIDSAYADDPGVRL